MGFKSDREFLRNVSIGAIGTRAIASILRRGGFRIIELERYCSSNKIWATKIKRLRVPDLLCLKSGIRIECRAKAHLKITMSHSVNNPARAWDTGLRDADLVAFIRCWPSDYSWKPSERVALFQVGDMRATQGLAKLERMKSATEGSEVQITWPSTVPNRAGVVSIVSTDCIRTALSSGRQQSYRLSRRSEAGSVTLTPHVAAGDSFGDGDTILASALPAVISTSLPDCRQYDFLSDVECDSAETVYAGVKALGYLPDIAGKSRRALTRIMESSEDARIRLEAAASLARLGCEEGWKSITGTLAVPDGPVELRMECALLLAELPDRRSIALLRKAMENTSNTSELRAAAAWGLASVAADAQSSGLLNQVGDADEVTALHAILGIARLLKPNSLASVLRGIGDNDRRSAGLVRAVLLSRFDFVPEVVRACKKSTGKQRQWLLYLLACRGREAFAQRVGAEAPELVEELDFFWTHQVENWTNRLDVADQIDFLQAQVLD